MVEVSKKTKSSKKVFFNSKFEILVFLDPLNHSQKCFHTFS